MKWNDRVIKQGIIISVLIVILTMGIVGTVAAADPQIVAPGGWGNGTPHMANYQNMTANAGSMWGHGNMMQGYGQARGMWGAHSGMRAGAGTMHRTGGMQMGFMFFGALIAELLMIVWLIVGILVIVFLLRKLKRDKTP
jgi:hypothetical protein